MYIFAELTIDQEMQLAKLFIAAVLFLGFVLFVGKLLDKLLNG